MISVLQFELFYPVNPHDFDKHFLKNFKLPVLSLQQLSVLLYYGTI